MLDTIELFKIVRIEDSNFAFSYSFFLEDRKGERVSISAAHAFALKEKESVSMVTISNKDRYNAYKDKDEDTI